MSHLQSSSAAPWWEVDAPEWLVADEDPEARAAVERLVGSRVGLVLCGDGAEALWEAGRRRPSVVIVSATLPVVPAAEVAAVLSRHRAGRETVLVGVGVGEADRAAAVLASGAGGVVSRPYRSDEIERLIRSHQEEMRQSLGERAVLTVGSLWLDGPGFRVTVAGRPLPLRLREFELLRILMLHRGGLVTQAQMQEQLRGTRGASVSPNTIAVHLRHLRARLRGVAEIVTVRGLGYRLNMSDEDGALPPLVPGRTWSGCRHVGGIMSDRDERPEYDDARTNTHEGATPGPVGGLDGAAAAGSLGAVGADKPQSEMPKEAPDPSAGRD